MDSPGTEACRCGSPDPVRSSMTKKGNAFQPHVTCENLTWLSRSPGACLVVILDLGASEQEADLRVLCPLRVEPPARCP